MLPLDSERVTRLCEYIMIGLAWHHWEADLAQPLQLRASFFNRAGVMAFEKLFADSRWGRRLDVTLGAGTFTYRAALGPVYIC